MSFRPGFIVHLFVTALAEDVFRTAAQSPWSQRLFQGSCGRREIVIILPRVCTCLFFITSIEPLAFFVLSLRMSFFD